MSIFDFLKRKKETEEAKKLATKKTREISTVKENKGSVINYSEAQVKPKSGKSDKTGFSYNIIKEPHISEKAVNLGGENKYVFKIYNNANKLEVKKSIEGIYGVDVLSVRTVKVRAKKRRIGRTEGFKKGYRKAIIKIKEGQKIEII